MTELSLLPEVTVICSETKSAQHSKYGLHLPHKQSCERQWNSEISKLETQELEKQHEAKLCIARQRLEIEKQMHL